MPEQELSILVKLKDEASAQLKQLNADLETNAKSWRDNWGAIQHQATQAGAALTAFGGVITAAFGFAYKASEDNRLAVARLTTTLHNLGTEYSDVESSLNHYIETTQKITGISRSEQLGALDQLLLTTGKYDKAMQLLPLALDLAKAKQMDTTTAALLLGRVAEGNINALNRYGFSMEGVKSSAQALEIIHNKVTGSAQALASPLEKLRAIWVDMGEAIGNLVAGPIGRFIDMAAKAIEAIKKWIETHPELAKQIAFLALAIGLAFLIVGFLILALVGLGITLALLGGPVTLVLFFITALIAAGIYLILNWDWVKTHWSDIWEGIKGAVIFAFGPLGFMLVWLIDVAAGIIKHWEPVKGFWVNMWNEMKFIALTGVNDIIGYINILLGIINLLGKVFGKDWSIAIPKISESSWGIFSRSPTYGPPHAAPDLGPPIMGNTGSLAPIPTFGNYGNLGITGVGPGGITVTINNAGSVISNTDLMNQIRQLFIELQNRNVTSGVK